MFDLLIEKNPALIIPVIALSGAAVVFAIWIVAHYWHGIRRQELESAMKQDMLNRGFGADEIQRVLGASASPVEVAVPAKETISDNEYYLVEKMLEEGHAIEDIEKLVRAFKEKKQHDSAIRVEA